MSGQYVGRSAPTPPWEFAAAETCTGAYGMRPYGVGDERGLRCVQRHARPRGVDLTGRDVSNVGLEAYRHVADVGRRLAEVHRDFFRHHDAGQHIAGQKFLGRGAAAAVSREEAVGRDRHDVGVNTAAAAGRRGQGTCGQQRDARHRGLAVKDLHAVDDRRLPPVLRGLDAVERVRAHRRVGFVEAVACVGCGQVGGLGVAVGVGGQAGEHRAVLVQHGYGCPADGRSLPRGGDVDLDAAFGHKNTSCGRVCGERERCADGCRGRIDAVRGLPADGRLWGGCGRHICRPNRVAGGLRVDVSISAGMRLPQ